MSRSNTVLLVVVFVGVVVLALSVLEGSPPNLSILMAAGAITAIISALFLFFDHYGWRLPLLSKAAKSPNIRGTWSFNAPRVVRCKGSPAVRTDLNGGSLVVRQSDRRIRMSVLWQGEAPSELREASPVSVNRGKLCFTGTYVELPENTEHAFCAFLMWSDPFPSEFVLRYCTDHGFAGEILAKDRRPWLAKDHEDEQKRREQGPRRLGSFFAWFRWM